MGTSLGLHANSRIPTQFFCCAEDIGVDGQIIDHITEVDLHEDFGIKVRLHRVKIIEGIKKLQMRENQRKTPPSSEILAKSMA